MALVQGGSRRTFSPERSSIWEGGTEGQDLGFPALLSLPVPAGRKPGPCTPDATPA